MKQIETETPNDNGGVDMSELNNRYRINEKFFASIIDMIPASVYLNPG